MKRCIKCGCALRVAAVVDKETGKVAIYTCANHRCANYKQEVETQPLPQSEAAK